MPEQNNTRKGTVVRRVARLWAFVSHLQGGTMEVKRMRTIYECLRLIKEADPESELTYNLVKCLCDNGRVLYIKSGKKYIVNYDDLLMQLFGKKVAN